MIIIVTVKPIAAIIITKELTNIVVALIFSDFFEKFILFNLKSFTSDLILLSKSVSKIIINKFLSI
jgi:hypothetical protein